ALKLIPGIGSVVGGVSMSILSGASTYAIGQVAVGHFERGGGFGNIDMGAAKRAYETAVERGEKIASELSSRKTDGISKLERRARLKERGVISEEDFEVQKKRILDAM